MNCKTCKYRIFKPLFGEFKCRLTGATVYDVDSLQCPGYEQGDPDDYVKPVKPVSRTPKPKTITENGIYKSTDDGTIGYNVVTVKVPQEGGGSGQDGKDGVSCTHRWDGTTLIITSASGTSSANLQGPAGQPGKDGKDGAPGKDGYTPVKGVDYFDGKDGAPGKDGEDGADGYTPVKGVDYFDGAPGKDGEDGESGVYVGTSEPTDETVQVWVNPDGEPDAPPKDGKDGYTPVKGVDYYTEADKTEMVQAVLAALPEWEGGSY